MPVTAEVNADVGLVAAATGIYGGAPEDYAAVLKKARKQAARQEVGS